MRVCLIQNGAAAGEPIRMARFPFLLGRHRDCDHRLYHPMVSRRHCQFSEAEGQIVVRDLDSLNGTYLNGRRIREHEVVKDGDEIDVGCLSYRIAFSSN